MQSIQFNQILYEWFVRQLYTKITNEKHHWTAPSEKANKYVEIDIEPFDVAKIVLFT